MDVCKRIIEGVGSKSFTALLNIICNTYIQLTYYKNISISMMQEFNNMLFDLDWEIDMYIKDHNIKKEDNKLL